MFLLSPPSHQIYLYKKRRYKLKSEIASTDSRYKLCTNYKSSDYNILRPLLGYVYVELDFYGFILSDITNLILIFPFFSVVSSSAATIINGQTLELFIRLLTQCERDFYAFAHFQNILGDQMSTER